MQHGTASFDAALCNAMHRASLHTKHSIRVLLLRKIKKLLSNFPEEKSRKKMFFGEREKEALPHYLKIGGVASSTVKKKGKGLVGVSPSDF